MNMNVARFIGHEQAKGDNMNIFMLGWFGLVDLDYVGIPLGVYRTEEEAIEDAHNIGPPDLCQEGTLTVYRSLLPGRFIGSIPVKKWDYRTYYDDSDNRCAALTEKQLPDLKEE